MWSYRIRVTMKDNLIIISNERFYLKENNYYCDNIAEKTLPDGLDKIFTIKIIARSTNIKKAHCLNVKNIFLFKSLIFYLLKIRKIIKEKNSKFLILSISPYTFFAILLFAFSSHKPFIYLRSDGFQEYKSILGFYGPFIYGLMFKIAHKIGSFISCRHYILRNNKGMIVSPSELTKNWIVNNNKANLDKIKLLYVGRLKKEKGIFSFVKMIQENKYNVSLSIVGATKNLLNKIVQKNITLYEIENNENNLIKFYDEHNIFILPSYTEGHPMVILESLARLRPVIIFREIEHIIENKKGIFIAERNTTSFFKIIDHIKNNYKSIQDEMKTNQLPTREMFLKQIGTFISN